MNTIEKLCFINRFTQEEVAEEVRPTLHEGRLGKPGEDVRLNGSIDRRCRETEPVYASRPVQTTRQADLPIYHAVMPGGKRIVLLKTLLTTACERDCYYCSCRAGRDFQRSSFSPDELARAFMSLVQGGIVQGLFLSSSVAGGGVHTQDRLIASAEILRVRLGFRGYIHLKIMPGAEKAQVERAMQLADRVSINLEAPNPHRLTELAPHKIFFEELFRPLEWVEEIRREQPGGRGWNGHWPSTTTQFVVGGVGEADLELLQTTEILFKRARLARAYFSRFNPIRGTPLENRPAENPWRTHRLYQASYLMHDYGFDLEELPFDRAGCLPLETDPKLVWARQNLSEAPLEINRLDRRELMRIPGIGPRGAQAILAARRQGKIKGIEGLKRLGIAADRAAPFVLLDGKRPPKQERLF